MAGPETPPTPTPEVEISDTVRMEFNGNHEHTRDFLDQQHRDGYYAEQLANLKTEEGGANQAYKTLAEEAMTLRQPEVDTEVRNPIEKKTGWAAVVEWFQKTFGKQKEIVKNQSVDQRQDLGSEVEHTEPAKTELTKIIEKADKANPVPEPVAEQSDKEETTRQNDIAKEVAAESADEHIVAKDETLGAIVKGLTGRLDWGMAVDYRSAKLSNKPTVLREANLIYPGQHVWIEGEKVVVSDEAKVVETAENPVIGVSAGPNVTKPAPPVSPTGPTTEERNPVIAVETGEPKKVDEKSEDSEIVGVNLEGN